MQSPEPVECAICMEEIDIGLTSSNKIVTECNHVFHSTCFLKNVAHNGFSCPCCRAMLADNVSDTSSSDFEDDDYDELGMSYPVGLNNSDLLRGFRMFQQTAEGESVSSQDIEDEAVYLADEQQIAEEDAEEERRCFAVHPTPKFILDKLVREGITMQQCIDALMHCHPEYEDVNQLSKTDDVLYGKMRRIISNYSSDE